MPRWNWTWEDVDAPTADASDVLPHPPDWVAAPPRRVAVSLLPRFLGIAVLALVVHLLLFTGGHDAHPIARRVAPAGTIAAAPRPTTLLARENNAVKSVLARMPAIVQGGPRGHEVALTFDDGPGPYSLKLVEVLRHLKLVGTFFAIGEMERYFSHATRAELADGDVVGDHTETHPFLAELSPRDQRLELLDQAAAIEQQGLPVPELFRPPYGSFDRATLSLLARLHMLMVLWSTDTSDYTLPGVRAIVQRTLAGAHPGAIILMHDAGGNRSETIAALPAIARGLKRRGLTAVTVPRLLLDDPPTTAPSLAGRLAGD